MKRKEFFKNIGTILIYAGLGTLLSIVFIGFSFWLLGVVGLYEVLFF